MDNPIGTTEAMQVARSNRWNEATACGYLDGKRDRARGRVPYCDQLEMTDYAHGYWRGWSGH
jgi:hypothetical protein